MRSISLKLFKFFPIAVGILFALLDLFRYAGDQTLGVDVVSRVLPAEAHRIGLGVPYKNFWEITPPGHYIVLDIWSQFFGYSTLSIKLLHLFVSVLLVFLIYYVLSKVFNKFYLFLASILIYFFLFSTRFVSFLLPAELLAVTFSMLGLASLFYFKDYKKALFIAGFLFFFSGQVKDPFLFSTLALIPYSLFLLLKSKKDFYAGIFFGFLGILFSAGLNIFYLLIMGSGKDYISILNYKSMAFGVFDMTWLFQNFLLHIDFANNVFFYFTYTILLPIIFFIAFKIYIKIKNKSFGFAVSGKVNEKVLRNRLTWQINRHEHWTLSFFVFGLFIGFVIQRSLGAHYYIVAVLPLILTSAICFNSMHNDAAFFKRKNLLRFTLLAIFTLIMLPKKAYFLDYDFGRTLDLRYIPKLLIWSYNNPGTQIEAKIDSRVSKGGCIEDIYGWGVGTTYLYAERGPCSRFFIANLVVEDWQRLEYKKEIVDGGPQAIIYNPKVGDINYKSFEGVVINFPKILNNCYDEDTEFKTLYWPKYSGAELHTCLVNNSGA